MITGKVTSIYGKDINTDDIIPASFLQQSTDRKFFKDYAFDRYDPAFRERCKQTTANIVIGGENFACGSSREQAKRTTWCAFLRSPILIFFIAIR